MADAEAGEVDQIVAAVEAGTDGIAVPEEMLVEAPEDTRRPGVPEEPKARSLYSQILSMKVPEKIKLAMRGNKDARTLLLNDSNKIIRRLVLQNPRITDGEVATITRNKSVDEELLRMISMRNDWLRHYPVRHGLVTNPRTPLPLAIRYLSTLAQRDIQALAKSRNVPSVVAAQARRLTLAKGER